MNDSQKQVLYYIYQMSRPKLSIIVPAYNEASTIEQVLEKVTAVALTGDIQKQLIVIDDGSTDGTSQKIASFKNAHPTIELIYHKHEKNSGKGSCIHTGINLATGDFIIIQDADLEYDPRDLNILLQPILENKADVVYGSRFNVGKPHRILFFWHTIGNKFLTFLSNLLSNLNLTDMECGYKLFKTEILRSIGLEEKRFGFEPEVTAKIAAIPGIRLYETGVSYYGRTYEEGKKINWKDGCKAIYCVIKYNLFSKKERVQSSANRPLLFCCLFFLAGLVLTFVASGTADEGDSIMHYLYARHAYQYPSHFFHQWAKPLYVLLAAPFAQFGMTGMKIFNLAVSTITLWLTYRTAKRLSIPNAPLAAFFAMFSPMLMIVTLSGLTEPLFACWMMAGIYGLVNHRKVFSLLWLSFLPFVRSEGLVILCVILVYLLIKRYFKYIPLLFAGHIVYAMAGYLIHKDPSWMSNTFPYAVWSSAYGQGTWMHYVQNLPSVISVPLCFLLAFGLLYGLYVLIGKFIFRDKNAISDEELYLVYGITVVYFIAHSAFWALGIFNSFGLVRVMAGIIPLMAIISLRGFNAITQTFRFPWLKYLLIAIVLLFPFINTKYAFKWKRDFSLKGDQQAELQLGNYVKQNFPAYKNHVFFYEPAYLSLTLDINYFDSTKHKRLLNAFAENNFPPASFLIWDDWFAPMEAHVELQQIINDGRFELLQSFEKKDAWGSTRVVKLFRVK